MKITVAVLALVVAFTFANRSVELSSLESLRALDASSMSNTKAGIAWVNENALEHLPVAATLRAENVIAHVAIRLDGAVSSEAARPVGAPATLATEPGRASLARAPSRAAGSTVAAR